MVERPRCVSYGLFRRREGALSPERYGEDAVVLGEVGAGRTCALRLVERERLPFEPSLHAGVEHVDGKTEASHRVPVVDHADGPEIEAWIADAGGTDGLAGAERSAGD